MSPSLLVFVEEVIRWHNRVIAYAFVLVTDRYPPLAWRRERESADGNPGASTHHELSDNL